MLLHLGLQNWSGLQKEALMSFAIVMPWRDSGCPVRKGNMKFLLKHYSQFPVILGSGSTTGGSRNDGALRAIEQRYDTLVFIDADIMLFPSAVEEAASLAAATGRLVYCYDHLTRLSSGETRSLLNGNWPLNPTRGPAEAGAMAISVSSFIKAGGYPALSLYEDALFWCQANALLGPVERISSDAFHLWHPPSVHEDRDMSIVRAYEKASNSPEQMKYILSRSKYHARFGNRF